MFNSFHTNFLKHSNIWSDNNVGRRLGNLQIDSSSAQFASLSFLIKKLFPNKSLSIGRPLQFLLNHSCSSRYTAYASLSKLLFAPVEVVSRPFQSLTLLMSRPMERAINGTLGWCTEVREWIGCIGWSNNCGFYPGAMASDIL